LHAQPGWQELKPRNGGFSVAMPGQARTQTLNTKGSPLTTYTVGTRLGSFAVGVSEPDPNQAQNARPEIVFDRLRDAQVKPVKGKVMEERKETIDGHPGREIRIETDKKVWIRTRFYLVDKKLYQLTMTGPQEWVVGKEADHFFDSFKLVEKK
jgi:hypothetical protein